MLLPLRQSAEELLLLLLPEGRATDAAAKERHHLRARFQAPRRGRQCTSIGSLTFFTIGHLLRAAWRCKLLFGDNLDEGHNPAIVLADARPEVHELVSLQDFLQEVLAILVLKPLSAPLFRGGVGSSISMSSSSMSSSDSVPRKWPS